MASSAAAVLKVTSAIGNPPSQSAFPNAGASFAFSNLYNRNKFNLTDRFKNITHYTLLENLLIANIVNVTYLRYNIF